MHLGLDVFGIPMEHAEIMEFVRRLTCRNYFQNLDLLVGGKFADIFLFQRYDD
jgi:hypothetical protein